jgi:transposase
MTYSTDEVQYILNLFCFFQKNNYNSIQIRKNIKDIFNVSLSTVYNWLPKYITNIKNISDLYKPTQRISKITQEIEKFIVDIMIKNKIERCKTIRKHVMNKFNINLSVKSVCNILRKNNITNKKVYRKINKLSVEEFNKRKEIMSKKITEVGENNIISIDEMGIYLNDFPSYGWARKGEKCEIITKDNVLQKRVSLIVAMNNKKIIKSELYEQNISGDKFLKFIREINYKHKNKHLLMDNAKIHHTKKLKEYINKKNIKVLYNIPYCPEFNPIENVNSMIRNNVRYNKNTTFDDIKNALHEFKNNDHKKEFQNIYNSTFKGLKS